MQENKNILKQRKIEMSIKHLVYFPTSIILFPHIHSINIQNFHQKLLEKGTFILN